MGFHFTVLTKYLQGDELLERGGVVNCGHGQITSLDPGQDGDEMTSEKVRVACTAIYRSYCPIQPKLSILVCRHIFYTAFGSYPIIPLYWHNSRPIAGLAECHYTEAHHYSED